MQALEGLEQTLGQAFHGLGMATNFQRGIVGSLLTLALVVAAKPTWFYLPNGEPKTLGVPRSAVVTTDEGKQISTPSNTAYVTWWMAPIISFVLIYLFF